MVFIIIVILLRLSLGKYENSIIFYTLKYNPLNLIELNNTYSWSCYWQFYCKIFSNYHGLWRCTMIVWMQSGSSHCWSIPLFLSHSLSSFLPLTLCEEYTSLCGESSSPKLFPTIYNWFINNEQRTKDWLCSPLAPCKPIQTSTNYLSSFPSAMHLSRLLCFLI